MRRSTPLAVGVWAALSMAAQGDESPVLEHVTVLGQPDQVRAIAGSATYIGPEQLGQFEYSDVNRVLRQAPGVYLQEEDALGLRPNIGIRGSGQDRSARITLLEDGVLIAPAPYAASAAYYFPTMRRMHAVEVLKGPAAITEGPRTVGGALNLISTPIPEAASGRLSMFFGEDNTEDMHLYYGASGTHFDWLLETVQQDSDGFKELPGNGDTGTELEDYLVKLRLHSAEGAAYYQALELKLGETKQDGNETYLGLTDADFDRDAYQRYAASQLDNIKTKHEQIQLTWTLAPAEGDWNLAVTAYDNDFSRNWYKLARINGVSPSAVLENPLTYAQELAWTRGADSPDDVFRLRNNRRAYENKGLQAKFNYDFTAGGVEHALQMGVRLHEDEEDRLQEENRYRMDNGTLVLTTLGASGSQANRVSEAEALAIFVRDEITVGDWQFVPGLRYEDIDLERRDYSTADPTRAAGPTRVRKSDESVVMGGLGVTYQLNDQWLLLGGVHEGFNPPGPGSDSDAEESLNYEFGARFDSGALQVDAIYFLTDYDNLVGTCTASTGGGCVIGDQFDGGEATVSGLEFSASSQWQVGPGTVPLQVVWTWTETAEFDNSFNSSFGPWGNVQSGDEMPYIPEHQLYVATGYDWQSWRLSASATYIDETRTVAGSGNIPASQSTDSYTVVDLTAAYALNDRTEVVLRLDNAFDDEYVAARSPDGARPGKPRTLLVGLQLEF